MLITKNRLVYLPFGFFLCLGSSDESSKGAVRITWNFLIENWAAYRRSQRKHCAFIKLTTPGKVDADAMVSEMLSLYRTRLTASDIDVQLELHQDVTISAYEGNIRQVLNNLFGNAFSAMRKGGILKIRTRCAADPRTCHTGASITIADNGPDIPAWHEQGSSRRSTPPNASWAGLGLWILKRIIRKYRGHL